MTRTRLSRLIAEDLLLATPARGCWILSLVDPFPLDVVTVVAEALDAARVEAAVAPTSSSRRSICPTGSTHGSTACACAGRGQPRGERGRLLAAPGTHHGRPCTAEGDHLVLDVADDGAGMDAADLEHPFERFYRGKNAQALGVPGTGLGLTIVHAIVDARGGEVVPLQRPRSWHHRPRRDAALTATARAVGPLASLDACPPSP